ncbi:MAG: translocation/assembly module TamB domain-containing protein [Acidobacteria bacterium]|nr:translocation/assembly module TamB domain-containing protein [Acidobacteriota bacterium]
MTLREPEGHPEHRRGMSFRRRLMVVAAALVATGAALVLLLHAPPVRRAALRYALPAIERQYGLRLDASRLDYNLAALRIGLADVRLSAPHSPDEPFFSAEYVSVTLARRSLIGPLAFEQIAAENARVLVRRRPDGSTNLPAPSGGPRDEPPPLRVNRLDVPQIALDLRDEQAARFLWIPSLAIHLTPDGGSVRLAREAEVHTETQITRLTRLEGDAAFDGRAVRVANLRLELDELEAQLDGSVTLLARDPATDLTVRGSGDAARLARWVIVNGYLPRGDIAFEATVAGPFDNLDTRLRATTDRLAWRGLAATDLAARLRVTTTAVELEDLQLGFEGGRVSAAALLPLDPEAPGRMKASWTAIDAASASRALAPDASLLPSATVSGELALEGAGVDPARWFGTVRLTAAPGPNARGRLALGGEAELQLRSGAWQLAARQRVGGVAPVTLTLQSNTPLGTAPAEAAIGGTARLAETDLPALMAVLRTIGLADLDNDAVSAGRLEADVRLAGALANPAVDGTASIEELAGPQVEIGAVRAAVSGRPVEPSIAFTLDAPTAVVGGQTLNDVRAAGQLTGGVLDLEDISARQPDGSGVLTADGAYSLRTRRYVVALDGRDWLLTSTDDQPVSGRVALRFAGEGSIDAPRGLGEIAVGDAVWDGHALGTIEASVALEGRAAMVQASAPEFAARADARVQLDAPYAATIDARAEGLSLARVLQGLETATPLAGETTIVAHAELPLEEWRSGSAALEVTSLDGRAGDLPIRLAEAARVRYERERVYVDRFEADAGETRISAAGDLQVRLPSTALRPGKPDTTYDPAAPGATGIIVTATGDVAEVTRAAAATGLVDVPVTGGAGPVALLARVTGALEAPVIAADLEVGPGSIALEHLPEISNLRVRAHAEDGWIELREGLASYQNADLSVTGRAPVALFTDEGSSGSGRGGDIDERAFVRARAANLTPMVLAPFLDPETTRHIEGSIDATLDAAASGLELAAVTGEFRIDRFDVRVADLPVTQRVPTRIVARDGFARVEAWDWVGQGATLGVRGQVRLADRQAAILANGVVDLRVLTPFVRDAGVMTAGRLEPRLSITGAIDDPRVDGDVIVSDGEIRVADPRVLVSDLAARTILTRTTARVASLTGSVNGGALSGSGSVGYTPEGDIDAQLSAGVRGMALEFPQGLRSELDADLTMEFSGGSAAPIDERTRPTTGPPSRLRDGVSYAGELSGTVTVLRSTYREPMAVVTGLLAGLRTQRVAAAAEPSPFLDALALDVRVVTDEDVIVDNNYARIQLGGDLRVIGTASAPAMSGRAELREGGQLFVGRNVYTVNVGAIDFANPVAIEPHLNVEAATRAGGEEIEVTITGSAESPTVALSSSSNPDLGQAELASLLLTGRRLEDLAPGDAAFVGTQVLGNFSAEALGFASRAVGLDTLRLGGVEAGTVRRDPTAVATELDPTTRLTFGKSLGSDVDVTFSQSLRDSDAQTWIIDYLPRRGLELRLVSDDEDLRSYGFRHDISFGAAARRPTVEAGARQARETRVAAVDVAGDLALPEARAREALQLDPGDRFDFGRWQEDRDALEGLYRREGYLTARVAARRMGAADGVALRYEITAGPQTRIETTGLDLDTALRTQLDTAWAQSVFDDFLLDEAAQIIRSRLAREGYLQPMINARIAEADETKTLVIAVDRGTRSTTTTVRIDGAAPELARAIEAHLKERGLVERAVSDPGAIERETTSYLRARGYLGARVTAGASLFEGAEATLPLTVDAGPAYVISGVRFDCAPTLPDSELRETAAVDIGAPYDPTVVEAARDRLVALYRRQGFAAAAVAAQPMVQSETASVEVAFAVTEGPRQVLGDVVVTGNRAIDTDVIVRALGLTTGAPLRADDVLQARTRVFGTGLFRRIDINSEPIEAVPATALTAPRRLRVAVEEWPAARLRYGFVVAEERPEDNPNGRELVPGISADLTRRTLFGRAIAAGTAVGWQRRERRGRLFANAPTFMGLPVESSLVGERSHEEFEAVTLVTDRTSVTWEQRTRVARNLSLSYAYTFERNHTFDTRPTETGGLVFDLTINIARLNAAAAWDTRDDPSDTSRGLLASSSFELAPEAVGSDIRFVRQLWQGYFFRPWPSAGSPSRTPARRGASIVFASAARAGVVVPLGGQELIPSERFFAGGSRTVRGVAEGALGPRDFFDSPAGGRMMIVLNQEARVPIYRWVRGVAFVDAGNVFTSPRDASLRDLVGSVGIGLRLTTPFALLRVDYARPVWGTDQTSGRWTFGIGQAF